MKSSGVWACAALIALALAALVGCGGGGGGGAAGGLSVFLTDDMSTGFDQIWVTVHKVELQRASGGFVTAFESTPGVTTDVTNLSDGAERFLFVGARTVPAGDYTGVRVTMATALTVFPTGSSTGDACVFDPALDAGAGMSAATFAFGSTQTIGQGSHVVIDFDLPNWVKSGSVVTPAFRLGDDSTLGDGSRHERRDFHGTVSRLSGTAPDQTFLLVGRHGTFLVETGSSTVIYNEDGSANPSLANRQRVKVFGRFDTSSNALSAFAIKIKDADDDEHEVKGATSNVDVGAGTFDVAPREVEGFVPTEDVVHVATTGATRYFTKGGIPMTKNEFFAALSGGIEVEAEGVYNPGTNTLTASKAKLHPEDEDDHEAEAQGTVANLDPGLKMFDLVLTRWFGFAGANNFVLHVVTDLSTEFEGLDGADLTSEQFYATVANGATVKVHGSFVGGSLVASEVRIKSPDDNPQDEVKGTVAASDLGSGTIHVTVFEWFGFESSFGADVTIQTGGSTEYQDADGGAVSQAAFFGLLSTGTLIDAKGAFAAGVFNATRVRIKD